MSLAVKVGVEIVVAKGVDYTVSTVSRLPGSPAEPFFANMARAGLEAGWNKTGEQLPWWYGALSAGTTGSTDFLAGQVLGSIARSQLDRVLAEHPKLAARIRVPNLEQMLAALKGEATIPGLDGNEAHALRQLAKSILADKSGDGALLQKLLEAPDPVADVELKSAVTRNLKHALQGPPPSDLAGFIQRNLVSTRHAHTDPLGGTIVGHAIGGTATGLFTGHPELGALVTLLDSLTEGLLARKAMAGQVQALTKVKSAMLLQGMREAEVPPDWKGRLSNQLLGMYSQMGEEVRLFGEDLLHLAKAADIVVEEKIPHAGAAVGAEAGEKAADALADVVAEHANVPPIVARAAARGYAREKAAREGAHAGGSVAALLREQVTAARHEIEHHANAGMGSALRNDFATELEALSRAIEKGRVRGHEAIHELRTRHPSVAMLLDAIGGAAGSNGVSPGVLSYLHDTAQSLLGKTAGVVRGKQERSASSDVLKPGSAAAQAVGKAILDVAGAVQKTFEHELLQVRVAGAMAKDGARQAAFTTIGVVGHGVTRGLLAAERAVGENKAALAATGEKLAVIQDRVGQKSYAALLVMGQSLSQGAKELVRLGDKALTALDVAMGFQRTDT